LPASRERPSENGTAASAGPTFRYGSNAGCTDEDADGRYERTERFTNDAVVLPAGVITETVAELLVIEALLFVTLTV